MKELVGRPFPLAVQAMIQYFVHDQLAMVVRRLQKMGMIDERVYVDQNGRLAAHLRHMDNSVLAGIRRGAFQPYGLELVEWPMAPKTLNEEQHEVVKGVLETTHMGA